MSDNKLMHSLYMKVIGVILIAVSSLASTLFFMNLNRLDTLDVKFEMLREEVVKVRITQVVFSNTGAEISVEDAFTYIDRLADNISNSIDKGTYTEESPVYKTKQDLLEKLISEATQ